MRMELPATPENVMRAVEALQTFAREQKMPEKAIHGLALALEECGSNIVNHALKADAQKTFRIAVERKGDQILIELRDDGPEFDCTDFEKPKSPAPDEDLPGGWGIQIVRRYTDGIRYKREGNENVLLLLKRIEESPGSESNSEPH